jgi:hypothetical protein
LLEIGHGLLEIGGPSEKSGDLSRGAVLGQWRHLQNPQILKLRRPVLSIFLEKLPQNLSGFGGVSLEEGVLTP